MKTNENQLRLLPHSFKRAGVAIVLLGLLISIPVLFFIKDTGLSEAGIRLIRIMSYDIIMTGVFIYCLSKDKMEDEMILLIRLQSIATAFIFGILYVMIQPLINFIFFNESPDSESQPVVFAMIIVYLVIFIYKKRKMS